MYVISNMYIIYFLNVDKMSKYLYRHTYSVTKKNHLFFIYGLKTDPITRIVLSSCRFFFQESIYF